MEHCRSLLDTSLGGTSVDAVVIAIGGSILAPEQPDPGFAKDLAARLAALAQDRRLFVVVGGGRPARNAIRLARASGCSEERLDRIGIAATRLNAQTLMGYLEAAGLAVPADVPQTTAEAATLQADAVVMGGTGPGHSTDQVAAELAHHVAGRLVIATNVDGVYDRDPRAHPDAERLETLDFDGLVAITGTEWKEAGMAGVIDGPAAALIQQRRIPTRVVEGTRLDNLVAAATGNAFDGTEVGDS